MYRKGKGVPQDDAEALKWFLEAAELEEEKSPVQSGMDVSER